MLQQKDFRDLLTIDLRIKISYNTRCRLEEMAQDYNFTMSELIRGILDAALERHEEVNKDGD